ncbi:MAG: hypothetical protein WC539_03295 [Nitrospirota bacterium]
MKKIVSFFLIACLVVLNLSLFKNMSIASEPARSQKITERLQLEKSGEEKRQRAILSVIQVLQSKIENDELRSKAIQKFSAMNDADCRLVSSLCERISQEGDSVGAQFALLLVTALIITS